MVNILACMSIWLRKKFGYFNRTAAQRYIQICKFVAINANLELIKPKIVNGMWKIVMKVTMKIKLQDIS
jgi:hypothetical protein